MAGIREMARIEFKIEKAMRKLEEVSGSESLSVVFGGDIGSAEIQARIVERLNEQLHVLRSELGMEYDGFSVEYAQQ